MPILFCFEAHPLSPIHVDCATAVMLKILDGKCKMRAGEKVVMEQLYDQVKCFPGHLLGEEFHRLIGAARRLQLISHAKLHAT